MRRALTRAALAVTLAGLLGAAPSAAALEPVPDRADVIFSNGGRILSMKSDGTGRTVIFGKDRSPKNDELGAIEPDVSPDGRTVVFGFRRTGRFDEFIDVWRVGVDGKGARKLLASKRAVMYGDPAFGPDGRIVVAYFKPGARFTRTGLVSVGPDGGDMRRIFELKRRRRPYRSTVTVMEPAVSPDGRKVLYLLNDGAGGVYSDAGFENRVMIRDLASGRARRVAADGYGASWSPDGERIAYAVQTDGDPDFCWWETACYFPSSIAVMRADGSGRRFLTGKRLDERSPDWSRDGRIVFQSARNVPDLGEAYEIYSIRPNGSCLTMLTNGSPASVSPVWSESGGETTTAPSKCGAPPPETGTEVRVPQGVGDLGTHWLGNRAGTRLLTGVWSDGADTLFLYGDCARQKRSRCDPPLGLLTFDVCSYRGYLAEVLAEVRLVRTQRGVPIFRSGGSEFGPIVLLLAGRTVTYFFGGSGGGKRLGTKEVNQLRRFDQAEPGGDLGPVLFPGQDLRVMKKVKAARRAAGTVAGAAERLGRSRSFVRRNLRAARKLARLGEYGSVECPPRPNQR